MPLDAYPYAKPYKDRHGKQRWRFRHAGKTISLPGEPGSDVFQVAYDAAVEGRVAPKGEVRRHPNMALPRTLKAAWRLVTTKSPEWKLMEPETRRRQASIAESFFADRVSDDSPLRWGDACVADIRRRHIKAILAERADTPFAAKHLLNVLRKMIVVALDEEWIEHSPITEIKWSPEYGGWRAWTTEEMQAFEKQWPIGSTPRLAYALALWLGNRRSDVVKVKPSDIRGDYINVIQKKGGKELWLPITPMLKEVLDATDLTGPTILMTAWGKPFSAKSITGKMKQWTRKAGLPNDCVMHGLRKTLGKLITESGGTTRQLMDTLGHDDITHAELYSRGASQKVLANDAMASVVRYIRPPKKPVG